MNKTALKNFAIYSREKLIKDIQDKARLIGVREEGIVGPLPQSTKDMKVFNIGEKDTYRIDGEDLKKYEKLIKELEKRQEEGDYNTAYNTLIEEVAYTWFNRIIAIRFMEVNNYMPDRMRVLSSGREGVREPEFLTHYRDTDIGIIGEEFASLDELKLDGSNRAMEELFQFLFIKQCNALNKTLPELFEKTNDYAELLLNISYEDPQGVVRKLIEDVGEEPFDISESGQIEIIGWLYQYYNTVPKAEVDAAKKKVDKNTLPAKTQLFTPEWIVKYMVQNSLGRLWIERKIAIGTDKTEEELAKEYGWEYYLPEAEQIEEVKIQLKDIREDRKELKIEDITFIDPSMGSGHILAYAFEMFMQFYLEEGYMERQAAESIIENNLYGLDIDKRAYQLAYFAIMMKGRQYSRRILIKEVETNLYYFIDSKDISLRQINFLGGSIKDKKTKEDIKKDILEIVELFKDAKELGSIIKVEKDYDYKRLYKYIYNVDIDVFPIELIGIESSQSDIKYILKLLEILSDKYHLVVTNPPYLKSDDMPNNLNNYIQKYSENAKYDTYSAFMYRCKDYLKLSGIMSMITMHNFMFSPSFKNLRNDLKWWSWINMIHLGSRAFSEISGEVVQTAAYVIRNSKLSTKMNIIDLTEEKIPEKKEELFLSGDYKSYQFDLKQIDIIPENAFGYLLNDRTLQLYRENKILDQYGVSKAGIVTGKDKYFVKLWYEIDNTKITYLPENKKVYEYVLFSRGGTFFKWYGNTQYVLKLNDMWDDKKTNKSVRRGDIEFYYKRGIGWSQMGGGVNKRFSEIKNAVCKTNTPMFYVYDEKKYNYILGFLNSKIPPTILKALNPTLSILTSDILDLPFIYDHKYNFEISRLVENCYNISKVFYKQKEENWQFEGIKYIKHGVIETLLSKWIDSMSLKENQFKKDSEELDGIYSKIMDLEFQKYNNYNIECDYKSIHLNIKNLISYGVGCIFGRYSLDEEGIVYAGGEFDINRYNKIKPVEDNIVLITDEEYFEDDLANRFVEFVRVSFGEGNLEENIKFIGDSLRGKGTSREKIRNYFVNDFYDDHVRRYQKTPIYWLYDSSAGKTKSQSQNGFKALIYMHRYNSDTTGKVRIDYLHKVQRMYERRIDFLRDDIAYNKDAKKIAESEKELEKIIKQVKECKDYDEKIGHIALSRIDIDLDDGVRVNYQKIQTDEKGKKFKILAKI